jgi:hypothetical protein
MNRKQLRTVAKRIPGEKRQSITKEALRALLESMFPPEKKLISRRDPQLNEMAAWGTLANADSALTGISARIIIGNKTFYERTATINWLVDRVKE